jgi:hypothetical protein
MYQDEEILGTYKIYCFASRESIQTMTRVTNTIGVLDFFAMFADLALYKWNRILMKKLVFWEF